MEGMKQSGSRLGVLPPAAADLVNYDKDEDGQPSVQKVTPKNLRIKPEVPLQSEETIRRSMRKRKASVNKPDGSSATTPKVCPSLNSSNRSTSGAVSTRARVTYTSAQITVLEEKFARHPHIRKPEAVELAQQLELTARNVQLWFQNKRAKVKKAGPASVESGVPSGQTEPQDRAYASRLKNVSPSGKKLFPSQIPSWFSGFSETYECLSACKKEFAQPEKVREFLKGDGALYNRLVLTLIELDIACRDQVLNQKQQQEIVSWLNLCLKELPVPWQQLPLVWNPYNRAWDSKGADKTCLSISKHNLEQQKRDTGKDYFVPLWMAEAEAYGLPLADNCIDYYNERHSNGAGQKAHTPATLYKEDTMLYDWLVLFRDKEKTLNELQMPEIFYETACEYLSDIDDGFNQFPLLSKKQKFRWYEIPEMPGMQARIDERKGVVVDAAQEPASKKQKTTIKVVAFDEKGAEYQKEIDPITDDELLSLTAERYESETPLPSVDQHLPRPPFSFTIAGDMLMKLGGVDFYEPLEYHEINGAKLAQIIVEGLQDIVFDFEERLDEVDITVRLNAAFQCIAVLIRGAYDVQKSLDKIVDSGNPENEQVEEARMATAVCQGAVGELWRIKGAINRVRALKSRPEVTRQMISKPVRTLSQNTGMGYDEDKLSGQDSGNNVFDVISTVAAPLNALRAFFDPKHCVPRLLPDEPEAVVFDASLFPDKQNAFERCSINETNDDFEIHWQEAVSLITGSLPKLLKKYEPSKIWSVEGGRAELGSVMKLLGNTLQNLRPYALNESKLLSGELEHQESQPSGSDYSGVKKAYSDLCRLNVPLQIFRETLGTPLHGEAAKKLKNAVQQQ